MKKNCNFFIVSLLTIAGLGFSQNVWGGSVGGSANMQAKSANPAAGLVYASKSKPNSVDDSQYRAYSPGATTYIEAGQSSGPHDCYFFAKPARGYQFETWTGYADKTTGSAGGGKDINNGPWTGQCDNIQGTAGGSTSTNTTVIASFNSITPFTVTYQKPVGGTYHVAYSYIKTRLRSDGEYEFYTDTDEQYDFDENTDDKKVSSYEADDITLTVPSAATNFIGWYENNTKISDNKTLKYEAHGDVSIKPMFKELSWGNVSGDLTVNVTAIGTYDGKVVYVNCPTLIGVWSAADFTISPKVDGDANDATNEFGSIEFGEVTLDTENKRLIIPYTYTATAWGGISVEVTITPTFGNPKQFSIAAFAEEVVAYEACIEEDGIRTHTGTLADMMTQANTMSNTPIVKLMQNITITSPLSFNQSMTFDVNGKILTADCASAFSIDAADVDVQIMDGSFTQVGEIHTSYASSGIITVATFTQAAKLTMQGGTLSATNTGSGSAYGIDVKNGSVFYQTGGHLTVNSPSDARGVNVETGNDYATLTGGNVAVSAPTNAYGIWSAGQTNVDNSIIDVKATTTTNAYGLYINGGVTTCNNVTLTADAKTTYAYGANVNAGRLNYTSGSITATAVTSDAYGVQVAASANANIQTGTAITVSGGSVVRGINNLGTATILNANVNASATSDAIAVNSQTNAVGTTIKDGSYVATTSGNTVYGLHHQYGALDVDGGTFKGISTDGNNAYGARFAVEGAMKNATIWGETRGNGNTAYGFVGGVADKDITLTNCAITGQSATYKAYAIFSCTNVTATNCTLHAYALGTTNAWAFYAENGTNTINNCSAKVSANTTTAYGVQVTKGTTTIDGGIYDVEVKQYAIDKEEDSMLYGIYNASSIITTVKDATFNVTASNVGSSRNVYGAYINGTLNSSRCTYTVTGRTSIYGVYGSTASTLTLSNNTITAKAVGTTAGYGVYSAKNFSINGDVVTAKATSTTAYALNLTANAIGTVYGGKFAATGTKDFGPVTKTANAANVHLQGGYYTTTTNTLYYMADGYSMFTLDDTHPEYANGYRYVLSDSNPMDYVCVIGSTKYATLEEALQYTVDNPNTNCVIVMKRSYTLPAGNYQLPANASLLVPYEMNQNSISTDAISTTTEGIWEETMRLTLAPEAHLDVKGKIEVSAKQFTPSDGSQTSYVHDPYGRIHMEANSAISLQSGAILYAWGYITGSGDIIAKNGAKVYEMYQVMDMRQCSPLAQNLNTYKTKQLFPLSQYYVQNIECPSTYYYGAQLIAKYKMYYEAAGTIKSDVNMVGPQNALFLITQNNPDTWIRKSYNPATDRLLWEINSAAELSAMQITIYTMSMNSADYVMPVTNNMDVHILDGELYISNNVMMLPGSTLEMEKTARITIASGKTLYFVDSSDGGLGSTPVRFSPSWNKGTCPRSTTLSAMGDAKINLHGDFRVKGQLMTTTSGAQIFSNNADAGTVTFENASPIPDATLHLLMSNSKGDSYERAVTSAKLLNGDNTYTTTENVVNGHTFIYVEDQWQDSYTNGCFNILGEHVYAKPSEYVELKNIQTGSNGLLEGVANDDHTYTTIEDKLLICQSGCQWWEVEATATEGIFECKKEGYEGFYSYNTSANEWQLVKRNVTFYMDEAMTESTKKVVSVNYMGIPDQSVVATHPTKAQTAEYTYTFYGWKSSKTGNEYHWSAALEPAAEDMSYRPVFTATKRNYTITLNDANNGADVKVETPYGELPSYTPTKAPTAQYTYNFTGWTPALVAVTGPATYTANWGNTLNVYTVIFKDGEQTLQTKIDQPYGTATAFAGVLPTKEADNEFVYTFDGWVSSQNGTKYNNGSTPTVSGDVTYTAHYATTPRYMITFVNYDGEKLQMTPITQGEIPAFNGTPRRNPDRDGYFRFTGWMNSTGDFFAVGNALPAATQDETYTSQWEYVSTVFTITFANFDGSNGEWSNRFGEGETPSYDGATPLGKASDKPEQYYYEFMGWTPEIVPVTEDATYTAQWSEPIPVNYTITFVYDGYGNSITKEYAYGETPAYENTDPTPHKDDEGEFSYNFTGWNAPFVPVTGDATYTAQFEQVQHQYTITFVLNNGSANIEQKYYKNATPVIADPTKAATAEWIYTFAGWDEPLSPVLYDKTYTAQWNQTGTPYNVTFVDEDGKTILKEATPVPHAQKPTAPANPSKAPVGETFYNFVGWTSSVDANTYTAANLPAVGTSDVTYTAKYEAIDPVALVITDDAVQAYTDFATALNSVTDDATLKLMKDVARGNTATQFSKTMTLDLNGHTLSSTASEKFTLSTASTTVTIMDGSGTNNGKISMSVNANSTNYVFTVSNGTLNIVSGTIEGKNTNTNSSSVAVALRVTGGTVNIQGGTLTTTGGRNAYGIALTGGTTNISGGSIIANVSNVSRNAYVVYISNNNAKVNISGGELSTSNAGNTYAYSIYRSATNVSGTVTITGGKFKSYSSSSNRTFNSSRTVSGGYYVKTGYVTPATGKTTIELTSAHPEYANGYHYVVETAHTLTWDSDGGTITTAGTAAGNVASGTPIVDPIVEKVGHTFAGWNPAVADVMPTDANLSYTALWNINQYEITFANIDGNGGSSKKQFDYGTMPSYEDTPTKEGDGTYKYTFVGWDKEIEIVTEATTYTAQFKAYKEVADIIAGGDEATKQIDVDVQTTATNMTIHTDGTVNIQNDATVEVTNDFIIEANTNTSGELIGADKVTVSDNVYFDYTFNTPKMRWNAIAFPWKVDATSGVQVGGKTLALGKDFDIIYYDGATRATQGPVDDCWKYVEDDADKTLIPGRLYMILFAQPQTVVRFVKKSGTPLVNTAVSVKEYGGGDNADANWNGIANPTLYHAYLSAGVEEGQVYNNADDSYSVIEFANTNFPVGKPVFVQAAQEQSVVVSKDQPANAPMRAASSTTNLRAEVEIMVNNVATDKVIVRTDEDAIDEYTIGSDLAKAGISSKVAQLWVNRYGTQLCKNTIAPVEKVAEYPLTIFAPANGEYILAVCKVDSDCAIYLTKNGEAIADLTEESYAISLAKGKNSEYGLRMVIKKQPDVVTSLDEALTHKDMHKVIYREHLYLIKNRQIHNAMGQFIK